MNGILGTRQALALVSCLVASFAAFAEPVNGWWWNPEESGRGYFLEARNGVMYLAGYFYDADGRATWLSSGGPMPDPYVYRGTLQSYRNGQTVFGAYRLPDPGVEVGPIEVSFSDDEHGTLKWPGGSVRIEREFFGEGPALVQPQTGWWWNALESGSGYSVEVQGESAFVVSFMYDVAGNPTWYFTAGPMTSPTHYEGDWLEIFGGQTMAGPYRAPEAPRKLGRVILDFASTEDATIQFVEGSGAKAGPGRTRSSTLHTQNPARRYAFDDQWPWWIGNMKLESEIVSDGTKQTEVFEFGLVFGGKRRGEDGSTAYKLQPQSWFSYHFHFRDDATDCDQRADVNQISQSDEPDYIQGGLFILPDLTYSGSLNSNQGTTTPVAFLVPVFETCPNEQTGARETYFLTNHVMPDFVHFGDRGYGGAAYSSSIYGFYPAFGYDVQRVAPHMTGVRRWSEDRDFWQTWKLRAYP